jgi:hypothetical protein
LSVVELVPYWKNHSESELVVSTLPLSVAEVAVIAVTPPVVAGAALALAGSTKRHPSTSMIASRFTLTLLISPSPT